MSQLKNTVAGKETIYIDVDEEITGIIEKVRSSSSKIVALVLPKRCVVLQSIVNMKLLKRSADAANKNVVLITSEAGLLPLAGVVRMHVAKNLQSRPAIPINPVVNDGEEQDGDADVVAEDDEADNFDGIDMDRDASKPVGELANPRAASAASAEETIELDDPQDKPTDDGAAAPSGSGAKQAASKPKPNKKLKVPNFNKFRLLFVVGVLALIGLGVFGYFALKVWPKATVAVTVDASDINTRLDITLSSDVQELSDMTVPAKLQETKKTQTQQAPATGQKNNGQKATGEVTFTLPCSPFQPAGVPAGTGVSADGLTFITQDAVNYSPQLSGGGCVWSDTVSVVAINPGKQYNIEPTTFSVAGGNNADVASSEAMAGGTDEIVKVVSQSDIDNAKQKITNDPSVSSQMKKTLAEALRVAGYIPVEETFVASDAQTVTSAKAGDAADSVTVTQTVNYTMLGAHKSDLAKLVRENVEKQVNDPEQKISDDGIAKATFEVESTQNPKSMPMTMRVVSRVGPDVQVADIKQFAAGKKGGAIEEEIKRTRGVTDVKVSYSPFWVTSVPSDQSKITVTIEKASE